MKRILFALVVAGLVFGVSTVAEAGEWKPKVLDGITGKPPLDAAIRIEGVPGTFPIDPLTGEVAIFAANGTRIIVEATGYPPYDTVVDGRPILLMWPRVYEEGQDDNFVLNTLHIGNPTEPTYLMGPAGSLAKEVFVVPSPEYRDSVASTNVREAMRKLNNAAGGLQVFTVVDEAPPCAPNAPPPTVMRIVTKPESGLGATYKRYYGQGRDGVVSIEACDIVLKDDSYSRRRDGEGTILHEAAHCIGWEHHDEEGVMNPRGASDLSQAEVVILRMSLQVGPHNYRYKDRRLP